MRSLLLLSSLTVAVNAGGSINLDPRSHQHTVESHHSIHPPLDKSQVYWNYGGSTVVTRKLVRLTADTQDSKGWLWNEYPIESRNWEVEFNAEVYSKPHFGGDGFGFWVLAGDQDPTFSSEPDFLNGPILGMKADFKGLGVLFDVYDNDNKRNNPSVFVLDNIAGNKTFTHDNDFESDMVRKTPSQIPGHIGDSSNLYKAHKCVSDFRNTGKEFTVVVKYLHNVLHVYIDNKDGAGFKFCLAVEIAQNFQEYHIAFTAATGQVADQHDITSITTRYLSESDEDFDDTLMAHYGSSKPGTWGDFFDKSFLLVGTYLLGVAVIQLMSLRQLTGARIDLVNVTKSLNNQLQLQWGLQGALTMMCLFTFRFFSFGVHIILAIFRCYLFFSGEMKFSEVALTGEAIKGHNNDSLVPAKVRLIVAVSLLGLGEIFFFIQCVCLNVLK